MIIKQLVTCVGPQRSHTPWYISVATSQTESSRPAPAALTVGARSLIYHACLMLPGSPRHHLPSGRDSQTNTAPRGSRSLCLLEQLAVQRQDKNLSSLDRAWPSNKLFLGFLVHILTSVILLRKRISVPVGSGRMEAVFRRSDTKARSKLKETAPSTYHLPSSAGVASGAM
jgi:hypothetical protein